MSCLQFKPITPSAREEITAYTSLAQSQICDLSFGNLYGWSVKYQTCYAIEDDTLFIRFQSQHRSHPAYLIPITKGADCIPSAIERLHQEAETGGYPLVLMGITPACRQALEERCPELFAFLEDEGNADYIYLREKLASLSGKALQQKRNHVNKFEKLYPNYVYEPITADNALECMAVEKEWLRQHNSMEDGEAAETEVIRNLLTNFEALGLSGGMIRVEGRIVAFTLGSPINADTFDIHIEKADRNYDGAYAAINKYFARTIPDSYTYLNREEDLGIEGLRKAKLSYKPELVLQKIAAILRHDCDKLL